MFTTVEDGLTKSDYPEHSEFREQDWHILAGFWHPVAFAHEIKEKPVPSKLLDVDLVIYRTADAVTVAKDVCPHRSTQLSQGHVVDDCLVCPMHGMRFDSFGVCRKIPSVPDQSLPISPRMNLQLYQSTERYGIIWTCLKASPLWP